MLSLAEGQPVFRTGAGRFTIGITVHDGLTFHVYLTAAEAQHSLILWTTNMTQRPSFLWSWSFKARRRGNVSKVTSSNYKKSYESQLARRDWLRRELATITDKKEG